MKIGVVRLETSKESKLVFVLLECRRGPMTSNVDETHAFESQKTLVTPYKQFSVKNCADSAGFTGKVWPFRYIGENEPGLVAAACLERGAHSNTCRVVSRATWEGCRCRELREEESRGAKGAA